MSWEIETQQRKLLSLIPDAPADCIVTPRASETHEDYAPDGALVGFRFAAVWDRESLQRGYIALGALLVRLDAAFIAARARGADGARGTSELVPPKHNGDSDSAQSLADESFMGPVQLAKLFDLPIEPLRKRLSRWRANAGDGWIENTERGPTDPRYFYRVGSVRAVCEELQRVQRTSSAKNLS